MSEQPPTDPSGTTPPPPWQPPPAPTYGQQPGQYPYPPVPMEAPASSKSTTALVLGITGLVVCPGILSIPAWIIGRQAVQEIDASHGQLGGRSQAQAGYILGIIGTVLAALAIVAVVALLVISIAFTDAVVDEFDDCYYSDTTYELNC